MPAKRIGFSSDFVLVNQQVGINTSGPEVKLRVVGTIKGDFNVKDETTLSVYSGFIVQNYNINVPSVLSYTSDNVGTFTRVNERETDYLKLEGEYNTLSEDIIVDEDRIFEVSDDSLVSVGTLESVSIQSHFSVPDGGTNERPDQPVEGMVRFNDDLNTLEFYNGIEWRQFTVSGSSGRGVFGGGNNLSSPFIASIDFINISSLGNALNFGNLTEFKRWITSCSSSTRGLWGGGQTDASPGGVNVIEYVTIASEGNAQDFGDLFSGAYGISACSSSTRAVFGGGSSPRINIIDYVEISTIGNALDFGDLNNSRRYSATCSSATRGFWAGGNPGGFGNAEISVITISSKGDSLTFGDLTHARNGFGGCSNSVRGLFVSGNNSSPLSSGATNVIDYINLSTNGDAVDFGDTTLPRGQISSCSSSVRGIFVGGATPSTYTNIMDYVTISTIGNAQDFGDLTEIKGTIGACSDSHGGLGGF